MRRLAVLHVVANRWWTGSAEPALDLARSLRARGHRVEFACIAGDALELRARAAGFTPPGELRLERTARPWIIGRDVRRLRQLVRERGLDLVHAHQTHDHWLAALALRSTAARLVRTVHHRRAAHPGPAARWLFGRTAVVTAPSAAIVRELAHQGVPGDRLAVVPGAVDPARFDGGASGAGFREELGLGQAPVVGCVARLVPGRGHDVLLHAVTRVRPRFPSLRVVLVGRGEGKPALERLVGDLGLSEVVRFAGYRGDDLPEALAALDVFVLLGAGSEESCRAALEAMAAARPVVAAPAGALAETVVDGQTGWLVPAEPAAVADRLTRLLADPGAARQMGEAGRARVLSCFTQEKRAEATEAAYARALGERAGLPPPGSP